MKIPINILFVEDSADDAALLLYELESAGYDPKWTRVQTEAEFLVEIQKQPEVILSDYSMPQFSGLRAAKLLRESGLSIPFILISGTVGEDVAVEAMKLGATDYLLKDRLARLGSAIQHALAAKKLQGERGQAEAARDRLAAILEATTDLVSFSDPNGRLLYFNRAGRALLGIGEREDITGKTIADFTPDASNNPVLKEGLPTAIREGTWSGETVVLASNGREIPISQVIIAHKSADGKLEFLSTIMRDITERKRAEAEQQELEGQLRQSQKLEGIGQLAGGIAHDFNNILAAIMMQTEMACEVEHTPEEVRQGLLEIKGAADRAANLTRQLLLFSRQQVMQPRQLDLNEVVTSISKMLRRLIREDVSLHLHLQSSPLMIHADAGMLDQVLMNLAVNACDAMPQGGRLIIETAEKVLAVEPTMQDSEAVSGRFAWLSVSDTGCGITPEIQARIFEPFFTTKEAGKGTGLGLATVFGIVKQHQGWLKVYSEIGIGTTFQIFLPASEIAEVKQAKTQAKPKPRGGTETILLAEDDSAVRTLTRRILERSGYKVLAAADGIEAEQLWAEHQGTIALLLTDLVMPSGVSGLELAGQLQGQRPGLKVIFTSGYSADIAGRELKLQPGQKFIQKPSPPNELLEAVRASLDS